MILKKSLVTFFRPETIEVEVLRRQVYGVVKKSVGRSSIGAWFSDNFILKH